MLLKGQEMDEQCIFAFAKQHLIFFRILLVTFTAHPNHLLMPGNYLKTAYRNLANRKGYTILNIFGLVTGMTCCLFIFHYISYEKSYDRFQPLSGQLARVRLDIFQNGQPQLQSATVYPAIAAAMKKEFSAIDEVCRLHTVSLDLSNEKTQTTFNEDKGFYADPSFLKMFDVKVVNRRSENNLGEPYQLLLSESLQKNILVQKILSGKK